MYTMEEMVGVVERWFQKSTASDQQEFLSTPKDQLHRYHDSLGRSIRNEFKLWETSWIPEIVNGVDHAKDHPDSRSMQVIEEVWERMRDQDEDL